MRLIENIGKDVSDQLRADVSAAPCFSITVDQSTDMTVVSQLCVWIRFPKEKSFGEEMLCLLPHVGQMRGEDILNALLAFVDEQKSQFVSLASVCTDGAPII